MLRLPTRKKQTNRLYGPKKTLYILKDKNKVTIYATFIIKPYKAIDVEEDSKKRFPYNQKQEEKKDPLLLLLNQLKHLKISLHRMFIPGNVSKKNKKEENTTKSKTKNTLLDDLFVEDNSSIEVSLSFYIVKVWKEFSLLESFYSIEELVEDFRALLRNELKQKLENVGRVGRILGSTLEEFILYSTLDHSNFLSSDNKIFSDLTKDYAVIEKNTDFHKSFKPGPAVDLRPESVFSFPTGITSDDNLLIGLADNDSPIGFPPNPMFPLLISGDKRTREIITCKLFEQNKNFILLDPKSNLEFKDRIKSSFDYLTLGEDFLFNVLTPVTAESYMTEKISSQYLGNFIDIIKAVSDVRNDAAVLLRDLIDFYVNEYQEEQEEILFPRHDTPVSLDDLYTMLTVDPGGLIITDFQLSTVRALINDIRDVSISETTRINEIRGLEQLFSSSKIIDFSAQGYKIQKLFLYSFLLQLTVITQVMDFDEDILIYIDDAELFFSREIEKTILKHILKKLENSPFKLIFSTPFPSQLASAVFDLTHNRIIGNLKSARCLKLISDSHGLDKIQHEFIRRLPKNNFLLVREDLQEKPILLRFFPDEADRHDTEKLERVMQKESKQIEDKFGETQISPNLEEFSKLYPVMLDVLEKLSTKVNRGINTESIVNLFPNRETKDVKETVSILELYGYIFIETVDKRGKKGEYWTKITPRGKKFLDKLKYKELIKERNKEAENLQKQESGSKDDLSSFVESSLIEDTQTKTHELDNDRESLQNIRKSIQDIRDSKDEVKEKLGALNLILKKLMSDIDSSQEDDYHRLNEFRASLTNLILEEKSLKNIPAKIQKRIFDKSLSLIDEIQIQSSFKGKRLSDEDEKNVNRIIENELKSDKWRDFEREVFLTEIPELSKIGKKNKKITDFLSSENPEVILRGLELSIDIPKKEFVFAAKKTIASLMQIKMRFYPNMDIETYLEEICTFFENQSMPEPFENSMQLISEYALLKIVGSKHTTEQKKRKKIIEIIQEESDSFVFDFTDKEKGSIVNQLISKLRKRMNNA